MTQRMTNPETIIEVAQALLEYLWIAERQDYLACPTEQRATHIYNSLRYLKIWLQEQQMQLGAKAE